LQTFEWPYFLLVDIKSLPCPVIQKPSPYLGLIPLGFIDSPRISRASSQVCERAAYLDYILSFKVLGQLQQWIVALQISEKNKAEEENNINFHLLGICVKPSLKIHE